MCVCLKVESERERVCKARTAAQRPAISKGYANKTEILNTTVAKIKQSLLCKHNLCIFMGYAVRPHSYGRNNTALNSRPGPPRQWLMRPAIGSIQMERGPGARAHII